MKKITKQQQEALQIGGKAQAKAREGNEVPRGSGANIEYITPKDNRGAGSWVSHPLEGYPDGTRVEFVVK